MSSAKSLLINGVTLGYAPTAGYGLSGISPTQGVTDAKVAQFAVLSVDWGRPDNNVITRPRAVGDGQFRRGRHTGSRTIHFDVLGEVIQSGATAPEMLRDDLWDALLALLRPEQGPIIIKQTRTDSAGSDKSRQIRGELSSFPAWTWTPDDVAPGLVGPYSGAQLVLPLDLVCQFPWFESAAASSYGPVTLDSSDRNHTLANGGHVSCGLRIEITGSGTNVTISITNGTGGVTPDLVGAAGIGLTGVSPSATAIIVDWYYSDPLAWSVTQGGTDLRSKLAASAGIGLIVGDNDIHWQVTSGTVTSGQITFYWRPLWGNV